MTALPVPAEAAEVARALPPLSDEQAVRVAALLSLVTLEPEPEPQSAEGDGDR